MYSSLLMHKHFGEAGKKINLSLFFFLLFSFYQPTDPLLLILNDSSTSNPGGSFHQRTLGKNDISLGIQACCRVLIKKLKLGWGLLERSMICIVNQRRSLHTQYSSVLLYLLPKINLPPIRHLEDVSYSVNLHRMEKIISNLQFLCSLNNSAYYRNTFQHLVDFHVIFQ